ncbi:MAG TPA: SMC family ATPase [Thermomicrobiales bacterium]|nr:SMC family ATPase [Thermomicrobiales bacterium]
MLLPVAERAETLHAEDERLEGLRKIALRKRELEQNLLSIDQRRRDAIASVHSSVTRFTPPATLDGWHWQNGDHEDPIGGCTRLLVAIQQVDIVSAERQASALMDARSTARDHEAAQKKLNTYLSSRKGLEEQLATLEQAGDSAAGLEVVFTRIGNLQREDSGIATRIDQIDIEHRKTQALADNLRKQHFDDVCPTCQRPFSEEDARIVLGAFDGQLGMLAKERATLQQRRDELRRELETEERERARLEEHARDQVKLRQRIEASKPYIDEASEEVRELDRKLMSSLRAIDQTTVPTEQDVVGATQIVHGWRRILDTREGIERARAALTTLDGQGTDLRREMVSVGEIAYDEIAHNAVKTDYRKAIQAQGTVIQIDRDLTRRPELENDLMSCADRIAAIGTSISAAEKERAAIGFDPAKLAETASAVRSAREEERIATERRHRVHSTLRDAEHALESVRKDQERIAKLATDADERQRDADRLDEMYREFTEFERFAAAWYAPRLSDITSEIVSEVTEGKYDRVVFDNNFGIDVYDGDEEKFPLETFSGGERDVIALAARIALSRVIGGQGAHPPGFLVLDEVFGSLDRERRSRLLDMLGAITSSGEHFRQIFMISHVDDVRTAPIFDELWLISESADGSSELQSLSPGADIGEL